MNPQNAYSIFDISYSCISQKSQIKWIVRLNYSISVRVIHWLVYCVTLSTHATKCDSLILVHLVNSSLFKEYSYHVAKSYIFQFCPSENYQRQVYWQCAFCVSEKLPLLRLLVTALSHRVTVITPLWKSNRNLFSIQFFYNSFFYCLFSFSYIFIHNICEVVSINSVDFCLISSDILKKATGETPDVALVWLIKWAKMALEHGKNAGIGA